MFYNIIKNFLFPKSFSSFLPLEYIGNRANYLKNTLFAIKIPFTVILIALYRKGAFVYFPFLTDLFRN